MHINLAPEVYWQQVSGPPQIALNLNIGEKEIRHSTSFQDQIAIELEDLLCRLFHEAKSVMVRPLVHGRSGAAVISAIPFYATGGGGREVVVKFGNVDKVEEEYNNFKMKSVQGKKRIYFNSLKSNRSFINPMLATAGRALVRPTYICTTHGDFNQHNLLIDSAKHVWLIDFQETGQSHILRDVVMLDSVIRFQLLNLAFANNFLGWLLSVVMP